MSASPGVSLAAAQGPKVTIEDITIPELLQRAVRRAPDRDAVVIGDEDPALRRRITYAELEHDVEQCARALLARFAPGDRIALWAPNVPEWVVIQLGIARAGMVLVSLNPAFQPHEAEYVLRRCGAVACFAATEYRGRWLAEAARRVKDDLLDLREVIDLEFFSAFMARASNDGTFPIVSPTSLAMIQFTSGTTGFPKGAMLHHRGVVNNATHSAERTGAGEGCVFVRPALLFHVGGLVGAVLSTVASAGTLVPMRSWSPALALELIETERANLTGMVPTMMQTVLDHPDLTRRDVTSISHVIMGAAPVPAELVRRVERTFSAHVSVWYGQTESGPVATMTHPHDSAADKSETVGTLMPGVEGRIVDPETRETVRVGAIGELLVRSYGVMGGYYHEPEQTSRTIDADGWLHTGDLCTMDDRHYVRIVGRTTDMIIRGGENVYPREIEEIVLQLDGVEEVAVVGLPHEHLGESVAAFVHFAEGARTPTAETLARAAGAALARYKVPQHWYVVDELPRTASGKVQKFALREQWDEGRFRPL